MDIKALITELEQVLTRSRAIVKEFEGKEIPAEKRAELTKLHEKAEELHGKIEAENTLAAQVKSFDETASWLARPATTLPQPAAITPDGDGRKQLAKMGWELKGVPGRGTVFAPTSKGMVAIWKEEVLFGAIPTGEKEASAAAYFRAVRASFQPTYGVAFGKWIKLAAKTRNVAMAFSSLTPQEQAALNEGQDDAGGYLVPPDIQAEMLMRKGQTAVMRSLATVVPCSRDILKFPRIQEASATQGGVASGGGSIFTSGFVGDWAGETPAFTDVDPKFGTFDVAIKKQRTATKLSNDFISDSVVDVLAWLATNGSANSSLVEDFGFIAGDGSPLKPKGILNSGAATVDVEGSTVNTISNTTAAPGSAPKILDLIFSVPSQYAEQSTFLLTRSSEGKTRKLVDGQGRFHWPLVAAAAGLGGGGELVGYPKRNSEFVQQDGTDTNKVMVYGDISAYVIADRAQVSVKVLTERFADTDQTGIILWNRVGGDTWNPDAVRLGVV